MRLSTVGIALSMLVGVAACAGGGVRYYDADHRDYHTWNDTEVTFYGQWETEGHRPHVEYAKRSGDEQREYWNWRHNHEH
jgi:ABC-type glycerol-3-phosphate transport system substrate-binding protein